MKTTKLKLEIAALLSRVDDLANEEWDVEISCNLSDASEYLRRAWHALDGSPCEVNDTTIEVSQRMASIA